MVIGEEAVMDNSGPAFPINPGPYVFFPVEKGLTKRELAAMFAMAGFCSNPECATMAMSRLAESSRVMADALLAALKEEKP
jgi:hypothetical protein